MRRRLGQALRLGVARGAIALVETRRWGGAAPALLAEQALAPDAIESAAGMQEALAKVLDGAPAGWPMSVVLADELVRLWQVTPPRLGARLADLEAAAAQRFALLYGESAASWCLRAGWDPVRPFLAAALPRALLGAIEHGCAQRKLALREIVPHFVAVLNRHHAALKPGAWFGLVHDQVLTLGAVDGTGNGAGIAAVRAAALPDGADAAWLADHVAREALRLNLTAPQRLQLCGSVPPAGAPHDAPHDAPHEAPHPAGAHRFRPAEFRAHAASHRSRGLGPGAAGAGAVRGGRRYLLAADGAPAGA